MGESFPAARRGDITMIQTSTNIGRAGAGAAEPTVATCFKVDITRGERLGRVSSEWFARPDDERYLSLGTLYDAIRSRSERSSTRTLETRHFRVEASRENAERLSLVAPGRDIQIDPTHWPIADRRLVHVSRSPQGAYRRLHRNLQRGRRAVRVDQIESPPAPRQRTPSQRLMIPGTSAS